MNLVQFGQTVQVPLIFAPGSISGESSTEVGGSTAKMVHSRGWQVGAGCLSSGNSPGQLARGLIWFHVGFSMELFAVLHSMVVVL